MKECTECKQSKKGLRRYLFASFDGSLRNMKVCNQCATSLERQGFLYKIKSDKVNLAKYIKRAQDDMQSLKEKKQKESSNLLRNYRPKALINKEKGIESGESTSSSQSISHE